MASVADAKAAFNAAVYESWQRSQIRVRTPAVPMWSAGAWAPCREGSITGRRYLPE
jgi:hypothetical protein